MDIVSYQNSSIFGTKGYGATIQPHPIGGFCDRQQAGRLLEVTGGIVRVNLRVQTIRKQLSLCQSFVVSIFACHVFSQGAILLRSYSG